MTLTIIRDVREDAVTQLGRALPQPGRLVQTRETHSVRSLRGSRAPRATARAPKPMDAVAHRRDRRARAQSSKQRDERRHQERAEHCGMDGVRVGGCSNRQAGVPAVLARGRGGCLIGGGVAAVESRRLLVAGRPPRLSPPLKCLSRPRAREQRNGLQPHREPGKRAASRRPRARSPWPGRVSRRTGPDSDAARPPARPLAARR